MFKSKFFYPLLASGLLALSGASHAAIVDYDFGKLSYKGNSVGFVPPPVDFYSTPFAHLTVNDDIGGGVWQFTLTVNNNLFSSFGNNAYVQSINFDFRPDPNPQPTSTMVASNVGGVQAVWSFVGNSQASMADIDFGTGFGKGAGHKLVQNDWVTWDVVGLAPNTHLENMYLNIKGIDQGNLTGLQAKYMPVTSSVPEPETYAMLLAGLGLFGFTMRRRKSDTLS